MVPQAKFARGIVWEFLDTAGGDKIATHVFKAQYILGQEDLSSLRPEGSENIPILVQGTDLDFSNQNDLRNPKMSSKQSIPDATE